MLKVNTDTLQWAELNWLEIKVVNRIIYIPKLKGFCCVRTYMCCRDYFDRPWLREVRINSNFRLFGLIKIVPVASSHWSSTVSNFAILVNYGNIHWSCLIVYLRVVVYQTMCISTLFAMKSVNLPVVFITILIYMHCTFHLLFIVIWCV